MEKIVIDIETYSKVDLPKCGVHKYAEDESFRILLFSYSIDYAPAVIVDLAMGEEIPEGIVSAIFDETVAKVAHNMTFELTCLSQYFGKELDASQWYDTMMSEIIPNSLAKNLPVQEALSFPASVVYFLD